MPAEYEHRSPGSALSDHGNRPRVPARRYLALARPAKVRNAVRRRVFERQMAKVPVDHRSMMILLGTAYGGWYVPDDLIQPDWTCYCAGAGHDVSFDLALISKYGATVRAFDPFPLYGRKALASAGGDPRFSFHEVAIATEDGPLEMVGRQDDERGNLSAVGHAEGKTVFVRPGRTVASMMAELGDDQVQLLKLDIEGSEYDVVPTLDLRAIGVEVFLVQFHHYRPARNAKDIINTLRQAGYRPVYNRNPARLTFVSEE